jgi:hypothetical protein
MGYNENSIHDASQLSYRITDIRDSSIKDVELYKRSTDDVFMFIKQKWSDNIEVENYWWVDSSHILEMNTNETVLYAKASSVDPWNGDNWTVEARWENSEFVTSADLYYSVSNYYSTESNAKPCPIFYRLQANGSKVVIKYMRMDTHAEWVILEATLHYREFGEALAARDNTDKVILDSYVVLTPDTLIAASDISCTVVGTTAVLGIAYNKGLQQWALTWNAALATPSLNLASIGYGHVGLDGSLTGGELPFIDTDAKGTKLYDDTTGLFNSPVYSVKELTEDLSKRTVDNVITNIEDEENIPYRCYGSGDWVYFVYPRIDGIISHYTYSSVTGKHTPVKLYLNNNVDWNYQSESFTTDRLGDLDPYSIGISDLLPASGLLDSIKPYLQYIEQKLWCFNPSYTMITFLNHSLGQYAYVWRNSGRQEAEKNTASKDTVDNDVYFSKRVFRQTFSQDVSGRTKTSADIWVDIALRSLQQTLSSDVYKANEAQNQFSLSQTGGQWSTFFLDNLTTTLTTSFNTSGFLGNAKSSLTVAYALSQFYSINGQTECDAGPGFVQHNLMAQCQAQSVTDLQMDAKRLSYFVCTVEVAKFISEASYALGELVSKGLGKAATALGKIPVIGGFLEGIVTGVSVITGAVNEVKRTIDQLSIRILDGMADMMGGKAGNAYLNGTISKKDLQLEAPHYYGNKHCTFMWPTFGTSQKATYIDESVKAVPVEDESEISLGFSSRNPAYKRLFGDYVSKINPSIGNTMTDIGIPIMPAQYLWTTNGNHIASQLMSGKLYMTNMRCSGSKIERTVPDNMTVIEGVSSFLSEEPFKNENISTGEAVFGPPTLHDYKIDNYWALSYAAVNGETLHVAVDDVKVIDGAPSNIVITGDSFCGIASTYTAIEVRDSYSDAYLRPLALTPDAVAVNLNRINCMRGSNDYHAFDGYSNRIVEWHGGVGLDKEVLWQYYCFQANNHFKRSNIFPPMQLMGDFNGPPAISMRTYDRVINTVQSFARQQGIDSNIPGENKNLQRYAIPVHSHTITTLPAVVRMVAPYLLNVVEGITSLTTDLRTTQLKYKAPSSKDFNINKQLYRVTNEYICTVQNANGVNVVTPIVPVAGYDFIGATTEIAYFYSESTRMYYAFTGNSRVTRQEVIYRFAKLTEGQWDFVNQEVMFRAEMTEGNTVIMRLDNGMNGEVYPPPLLADGETTIGDWHMRSMAGGLVYQGPSRFVVNRFITNEYMIPEMLANKGKWKRLDKYNFDSERVYELGTVDEIDGWVHNPWKMATSFLGVKEEADCMYEWEITFIWTDLMDRLYAHDEYATVSIQGETVTEGGTVKSKVALVYLYKELFNRTGINGYYSYRFQSGNGIGNRERLYVWSDSFIDAEGLQCEYKVMSERRMQPVPIELDVRQLREM